MEMKEKLIKSYIDFAIANGYELKVRNLKDSENASLHKIYSEFCIELRGIEHKGLSTEKSLIDLCTSKEFIDAVCMGLLKVDINFKFEFDCRYNNGWRFAESFASKQALAIYNGTFEEFIKMIIGK